MKNGSLMIRNPFYMKISCPQSSKGRQQPIESVTSHPLCLLFCLLFDEFFQNSVKIRPATRNRKPKDQKMKWKERVGITLAVSVVLVTSVLVLDIRLAQIRQDRNELHQQQQQFGDQLLVDAPVAHGRVRQKEGRQFQRRFLNRTSNEKPFVFKRCRNFKCLSR